MVTKKPDKSWSEYLGQWCKLVYEDGLEPTGAPHLSIKKGIIEKVTDSHMILDEENKNNLVGVNIHKILRFEIPIQKDGFEKIFSHIDKFMKKTYPKQWKQKKIDWLSQFDQVEEKDGIYVKIPK